jgi:predicted phosphodiesterase
MSKNSKREEITHVHALNPNLSTKSLALITESSPSYVREVLSNIRGPARSFANKSRTESRALVISDVHYPYHDQEALDAVLELGQKQKIDYLIFNGDIVDFYKVSDWRKDPERMSFQDELFFAKDGIREIVKKFPGAQKIYIEGNHEYRAKAYIAGRAPEFAHLKSLSVPGLLELDRLGVNYVSNITRLNAGQRPYRLGKLYIAHGHEIRTGFGAVNIARNYYMKTFVNLLVGHSHQNQEFIAKRLDGEYQGCWCQGCLCNLSERYSSVNNWSHGAAIVSFDADGYFSMNNFRVIDGQVI